MTHGRLSRVALLMLALLAGTLLLPHQADAQEPSITVRKILVRDVGQQDTPQGRDTSLSGFTVTFQVFAGATTTGTAVDTITVTLSENAQGQGNQGNGSQGTATSDATLTAGQVFTVCEIPVASSGTTRVPLQVSPRPTAGQGGSTGGQQTQLGTNCITFTQGPGNTVTNFLNQKATGGTPPGPVTGGPSSGGGFAAGEDSGRGGAMFATGALALALAAASLGVRRRRRA